MIVPAGRLPRHPAGLGNHLDVAVRSGMPGDGGMVAALALAGSGTGRSRPSSSRTEAISPSVWRSASRNTAGGIKAGAIARSEQLGCQPGVLRGAAFQCAIASSETQTVRLPRRRSDASYSAQFVTFRFGREM